ncbi:MAG: hypothetical protein ACR2RF_26295 [Geminicoccaceae bacterium]
MRTRKPKTTMDIRSMARQYTDTAIKTLVSIAGCSKSQPSARVAAASALLDRGWGRPKQEMTIEHRKSLGELTDAELEAIARGEPHGSEGVAEAENGAGPSDIVH